MPGYTAGASFASNKSIKEVTQLRADERKKHSDNSRSRNAVKRGDATPINSPLKYTNKGSIRKRPKSVG